MEKKLPKAQLGSAVKAIKKGFTAIKPAYQEAQAAKATLKADALKATKRAEAAKKAAATRAANKAAASTTKSKATKATTEAKPATKAKTAKPTPEKKTSEKSSRLLKGYNPFFQKQGVKFKDEPGPKISTVKKPASKKTVKPESSQDNLTKNVKRGIIGASTTGVVAAIIKDKMDKAKKKLPSGADVLKSARKYKFAKGGSAKRK